MSLFLVKPALLLRAPTPSTKTNPPILLTPPPHTNSTTATGAIPEGERPKLAVVTVDPATGEASLRRLSEAVGDFPTVHPSRVGLKCRCVTACVCCVCVGLHIFCVSLQQPLVNALSFQQHVNTRSTRRTHRSYAYVASMVTANRAVKWDGVAKIDLQAPEGADACVGRITLPPGHHNGETVFVPRCVVVFFWRSGGATVFSLAVLLRSVFLAANRVPSQPQHLANQPKKQRLLPKQTKTNQTNAATRSPSAARPRTTASC